MNFKEELDKAQTKQKEIILQIQKLDGVRQDLIQEILRLEGEIRAIQKFIALDKKE